MLSFIYRIAADFRNKYGHPPNVLYVNPDHLQCLLSEFGSGHDFEFITRFLEMDVLVYPDQTHPHVAWINSQVTPNIERRSTAQG